MRCVSMYMQAENIREKLYVCSELNSLQNVYFGFFPILRTDGIAPFCNLFIERPSYIARRRAMIKDALLLSAG